MNLLLMSIISWKYPKMVGMNPIISYRYALIAIVNIIVD